jgi:hypothetical protein
MERISARQIDQRKNQMEPDRIRLIALNYKIKTIKRVPVRRYQRSGTLAVMAGSIAIQQREPLSH